MEYRCRVCNEGYGYCHCTIPICGVCLSSPCKCAKAGLRATDSAVDTVKLIEQRKLIEMVEGKIKQAEKTVAVKADSGKTDWSLLPIESVEEILKVLEFGATKYDDWNWSTGNGFSYTRVFNATMRHLWAWFRGEDNDPETGLSHWAHAGCNVLFMLHFIKNKERYNQDDRKFPRAK